MPPTETQPSPFRSAQQKREDREAKRMALLRAAVESFNERGFHATSLDEVAASLGVSKPTIYHYLGNKDQVLLECLTAGLVQLREAADAARKENGNGLTRLKSFLRRFAEINMDDFGRCVIRTGEENLSPESARRCRALKREVDAAMRGFIEEGMADGSIAPGNPKLVAFTLAGAINWPARWHVPGGELSAQDIAAQMVEILTQGLAPRG
jgi:AcrR family transcriptional regulator